MFIGRPIYEVYEPFQILYWQWIQICWLCKRKLSENIDPATHFYVKLTWNHVNRQRYAVWMLHVIHFLHLMTSAFNDNKWWYWLDERKTSNDTTWYSMAVINIKLKLAQHSNWLIILLKPTHYYTTKVPNFVALVYAVQLISLII